MSIPDKILQAGCDAYAATFLSGNGSLGDGIEAAYLAIQHHDDWVRAGPPAWTGEGLPPVGTVCEHSTDENTDNSEKGQWRQVEIVAHHQFHTTDYVCAIWVSGDEVSYSSEGEHFRPARTPEQIVADEREAAITDIALILGKDPKRPVIREKAAIIYDAGYRKQVES